MSTVFFAFLLFMFFVFPKKNLDLNKKQNKKVNPQLNNITLYFINFMFEYPDDDRFTLFHLPDTSQIGNIQT